MNRRNHLIACVLLVISLILALGLMVGCGSDEETTTTGPVTTTTGGLAEDQTLVLNIRSEPPSLDPNLAPDTISANIINNIFEGLVHIDPKYNPFPGAAERWEVSDDGLVYTFHLRGTDKWTNGDPVTSTDFKNAWLRILDPATAADYAYMLYPIKGAEEYNTVDPATNKSEGPADAVMIETPDAKTLRVTLTSATPWFIPMMSHQAFFPIPKKAVDQFGDKWTEPQNIVTNGPFKLVAWRHDSDLMLTKWDDWRAASDVALKSIKMVMINEAVTGVAAFENGEIDIQDQLPPADMARLKKMPEYKQFPAAGLYYYGFNVKHPPLDNVNVRKALSLAIDRQSIIDNFTRAGETAATGLVPKGMVGFDTIKTNFIKPNADVATAKQLLAQAGYPDGKGLPEIVIYYNTDARHQAVATAIQAQWKAIGVKATLKNMEWKQYLDFAQNNPSVMVYRMAWSADFNDPYNFLDILRGGGGNNFTRWANATYDANLAKALTAKSTEERTKIYADMERIVSVNEMPIAPIMWDNYPNLVKTYVQGYEPNPIGQLTNLWTVKILKH